MSKPANRASSRHARDAVLLLGQLIRRGRIEHKMTVEQLAERAGVSRGLVQRIEKGDPGCSIGAVFEAAAITSVPLFDAGPARLADGISANNTILTLLPKTVHLSRRTVKDDF
jgi:transcriptional regulator with XRE-family HTH domain